jgi:hypothetical protein
VEDPGYIRFHLFYRGPVVIAPLLGALVAPSKPLVVYHYEDGRYRPAYTLERRFLVGADGADNQEWLDQRPSGA